MIEELRDWFICHSVQSSGGNWSRQNRRNGEINPHHSTVVHDLRGFSHSAQGLLNLLCRAPDIND